jgi:DNA-directed RNA polymerase subunit RPC12/RpoP
LSKRGATMARFSCPDCARKVRLPDYVVQATLRCPQCSRTFQVKVAAPFSLGEVTAEQTGSSPRVAALLAPAHQCQHCAAPIRSPIGRPAATVVCPSCEKKTSVYAVLHRCPSCGKLLESPSRSTGTETVCPACASSLRVPADVLRKEPPANPDEFWFGFDCLACAEEVATREKDVRTYAVCPHCLVPQVVPHSGHYLEGGSRPAPPRDPLDSLHAGKEVACVGCGTRFPSRASECPSCGTPTPSPCPW